VAGSLPVHSREPPGGRSPGISFVFGASHPRVTTPPLKAPTAITHAVDHDAPTLLQRTLLAPGCHVAPSRRRLRRRWPGVSARALPWEARPAHAGPHASTAIDQSARRSRGRADTSRATRQLASSSQLTHLVLVPVVLVCQRHPKTGSGPLCVRSSGVGVSAGFLIVSLRSCLVMRS
jgi:hypothetical protein